MSPNEFSLKYIAVPVKLNSCSGCAFCADAHCTIPDPMIVCDDVIFKLEETIILPNPNITKAD